MQLKVFLDDVLMVQFKDAIREKEGKFKGNVPKAITEAIKLYISNVFKVKKKEDLDLEIQSSISKIVKEKEEKGGVIQISDDLVELKKKQMGLE